MNFIRKFLLANDSSRSPQLLIGLVFNEAGILACLLMSTLKKLDSLKAGRTFFDFGVFQVTLIQLLNLTMTCHLFTFITLTAATDIVYSQERTLKNSSKDNDDIFPLGLHPMERLASALKLEKTL